MSRRRWLVLLGPPILAAMVAAPTISVTRPMVVGATSSAPPRPIVECEAGARRDVPPRASTSWSRLDQRLDASGALEGWRLRVGAPGRRPATLVLPAASTVSGAWRARIVAASEGTRGTPSVIRIVDPVAGCATAIRVRDAVVRRAVANPGGPGVLGHILRSGSRADRGIWRIGPDGRLAERVLEPLPEALREAAGMDRVWATDLRLDAAGTRLAVQSCHPRGCLTRLVDLATREVTVIAGADQGAIAGLRAGELVTWAACPGLPCDLLAWALGGGPSRVLAAAVPDDAAAAATIRSLGGEVLP